MGRIRPDGVTIATPFENGPNPRVLSDIDLRSALAELCPEATFTFDDIATFYLRIQRILGMWSAEQDALDSVNLTKGITAIGRDMEAVSLLLSSNQTGLRDLNNIEILGRLTTLLALDPEIGSHHRAEEFVSSVQQGAAKLAQVCSVAAFELKKQVGKSGRPRLEWHDEFTKLLEAIAKQAGVAPQLWKDRNEGDWHGWLFDAARKLESFFPEKMRSETDEACGKRLERSKTRNNERHLQNPHPI